MSSPDLENIVALLEASRPTPDIPVEDFRRLYDQMGAMLPTAAGVTIDVTEVGGVPGVRFTPSTPSGEAPGRTILYLHGGGYSIGSSESHRALCSHLAVAASASVFCPDYRLAPEHPYPGALDDAIAAYGGLLAEGGTPDRIVIAGDSAGGGLALGALMTLRDAGAARPAVGVLISPWLDLTQSGASMLSVADDPILSKELLDHWAAAYLGSNGIPLAPESHQVSPLFGELADLPPLLVHVGTREVLRDDAARLAGRAEAVGADVTLSVGEGMIHVWHLFAGAVPEAGASVDEIGRWIQSYT